MGILESWNLRDFSRTWWKMIGIPNNHLNESAENDGRWFGFPPIIQMNQTLRDKSLLYMPYYKFSSNYSS